MKEIESLEDVKILVNDFYDKIRKDKDLAPIFNSRIENNNWQPHLEKMYVFWDSLLFHKSTYKGNPFSKHQNLPVQQLHFDKWVNLFTKTLDENFKGIVAEDAKLKAKSIAYIFSSKMLS